MVISHMEIHFILQGIIYVPGMEYCVYWFTWVYNLCVWQYTM